MCNIRDFIQWDIKTWSKALLYWEENIEWEDVKTAIELGAREGGLSLWLALKGKQVICSDLKDVKKSSEKLHNKYDVSQFIQYQDIDACDIPYENYFDLVVFKSVIGGIGSNDNFALQEKVFKEIHKCLKPGGKVLFAENLKASPLHQCMRKKFIQWGNRWRYLDINEIKIFLRDFSDYEIKTTGFCAAFGRNEFQRNILATLDNIFFNKICPSQWQYVAYGIATK